jgi:spermidine synthase
MALWIPLYESNIESIRSVLATFFQAFPHGTLWCNTVEGEGYDAVLLGQVEPTQINLEEWQQRWLRPDHARVKQSLEDVGFSSIYGVLATYSGCAADLADWLQDAQLNTDGNLRLQYLAGLGYNTFQASDILLQIQRCYRFPNRLFRGPAKDILRLKRALEGTENM